MKETAGTSTSRPCRLSERLTRRSENGEDIGGGVGFLECSEVLLFILLVARVPGLIASPGSAVRSPAVITKFPFEDLDATSVATR